MNNRRKHQATDIAIRYDVDKFKEIESIWSASFHSNYPDLLLLLALVGIKESRRISLDADDGKGLSHHFSRTVYQRNSVEMDSIFGLITILGNLSEDSSKVINEMAFAKMYTHDVSFAQLPNVKTFYEYVLGGIEPLHKILFDFGKNREDIINSIYDQISAKEEDLELQMAKLLEEDLYE